ncbi:MAG: gas vesicle protein GvpN [Candidatus Nanopelagicales bacterium]|nr:gas vesicle protein GvpN [Candidatus Nanopelagicales bacterium]MDZ4249151.1 gas vesicle protein GvpN [Candidatus Nanopelagicales bacterium]MDZ7577491.1 gas vesicle protein GvpN [Candidatus Nanopelagicales bacterium]
MTSVVRAVPRKNFVATPYIEQLTARGLDYLAADFPLHLCGPSGVGKTTLAMHIAHKLGRPVMLMSGDDEFGSSDLVGGATGYNRRRTVDRFIRSVTKVEESMREQWVDNRLTVACREGLTLVYDEFTRSRPEANNALLSVLEEGILILPTRNRGSSYLKVHPEFKTIFTSNPDEYAGVHKAQDALLERMVTIDLACFDHETETAITQARSGVDQADALVVVSVVRKVRELIGGDHSPSLRSAVVIARVLFQKGKTTADVEIFEQACLDVLLSALVRGGYTRERGVDAVSVELLGIVRGFAAQRPSLRASGEDIEKEFDEQRVPIA